MKQFIKGWSKFLLGITDEKAKAKAKICDACDHINRNGIFEDFINDEIVEVSGTTCNYCSCPIGAIVRSDKKCPINKF